MISVLLCAFIFGQDSIPYKPSDEFEVRLNYQFKQRPAASTNEFKFDDSSDNKRSSSPLPYLTIDLEILKTSAEEERIRGLRGDTQIFNKRGVKSGMQVEIEMGYTDDMKDRVTPHEYTFIISRKDKVEIYRIVIFIGEDGAFLVNGEKRGQF